VFYYRQGSAASFMNPHDMNEEYISSAKYLYVTGITPALSDSCHEAVFQAMKAAKKNGVKIMFDPNLRKTLWDETAARQTLTKMAAYADIILPGMNEGQFLFEKDNPEDVASAFHQLGAELVVIKLGEEGAYYSTKNESAYVEGFKVARVIDPVGAGDGFAAGILSGLIDKSSLKETVRRGCAIGAMVVTVEGDIEGLPDKKELYEFMNAITKEDVIR